jgi:MFS family permease
VWGVSSIVGPLLGGVIVDRWSWRWVFLLNLPLGAVVALLALAALPAGGRPARRPRLDLAGAAAFVVGVTALMLAVLEPGGAGAARARLGALAVAGLGLALFVRIERRSRDPLLPLGLLGERPFAAGSAAAFFSGAAMFGALVHVPLLVQWGQGTDATTAGLALMTMSTGWSAGGLFAGQVLHRVGFRGLTVTGAALMSVGYTGLALRPGMSWASLLAVGGLIGIGMGLLSITLVLTVQTVIAPVRRGVATAGILFFRNVGATLGVAVMGAMLTARLGVRLAGLGEGGAGAPPALGAPLVDGLGAVFWVGASATVLGLVATGFLPGRAPREAPLAVPEDLAG